MNRITIVTVSDNHYLVLLAALIKSVETNCNRTTSIRFIIVSDGISTKNRQKLESSFDSKNLSFEWKEISAIIPPGLKLPSDRSSYPLNIYARIFIPYFTHPSYDKVLYMDVDMIALTGIEELWDTSLEGYPLAAVMDPRIKTVSNSWGGVRNFRELGLSEDTAYFNSGLLLFNLKEWRTRNIAEKIVECVDSNQKYLNYPDQYAMNVVLAGQWRSLDSRWNHFVTESSKSDPFIIHFVERKPIYKSYSNNPSYQQLFFSYLEQTNWKNFKLIGEGSRYLKKLKNLITKFPEFRRQGNVGIKRSK